MAAVQTTAAEREEWLLPRRRRIPVISPVWKFIRQKPLAAFGGLIIVTVLFIAFFAPLVTWHSPTDVPVQFDLEGGSGGGLNRLADPSTDHIMGTDDKGRDVWARVAYGSRISMQVGFAAVAIAVSVGTIIGLVSGYFGGWTDTLVQRLVDAMLAFPPLILALAIVGLLGPETSNLIISIGIIASPSIARVVRGAVLSAKENQYVEAARSVGANPTRIMFRHVLPNVTAPIIIIGTALLGTAILVEASLAFLGFGTPPPDPSWGRMLSGEGRQYMVAGAWWIAVFPGLAITISVLGFNLLGDGLRDVLDPRLRGV
ncbi:MAG TPA: ABC transporter permease [Dehalococcoidia bacterium]|nr:ABC transporter permease [Dehalococcoidia bacterium]